MLIIYKGTVDQVLAAVIPRDSIDGTSHLIVGSWPPVQSQPSHVVYLVLALVCRHHRR